MIAWGKFYTVSLDEPRPFLVSKTTGIPYVALTESTKHDYESMDNFVIENMTLIEAAKRLENIAEKGSHD